MLEKQIPFYTVNKIRSEFLNYFRQYHHTEVPSSSLVPYNDPTLLFTNAGMVQFKDVFLGKEQPPRPYTRATSSQRCVRAGGKHNDLERVGYTARHHTFFEMLGNFSFGDYFKQEAIVLAWRFLTKILNLPAEKLWITVFREDNEAATIWLNEIKIDPKRLTRCNEDSNFWSMGPTGPCGPCTEIFYDHGPGLEGGPPGSPDEEGDRYVEIWNLVFMQYDRAEDGTLSLLPKPSVDTGMGLERIAAVMQVVQNNYDIDLFKNLIQSITTLSGTVNLAPTSLRVIADHIRSCAFLIMDEVLPANEGRGYVLRRIIRRAVRHGNQLGLTAPFLYQLVKPLVAEMGGAYPGLVASRPHIEKILLQEEEQFSVTLSQGLKLFEQAIQQVEGTIIPGEVVFKLYDTYGFPADLTADIARERGLALDEKGFERAMAEQRQRSRQSSKFTTDYRIGPSDTHTEFLRLDEQLPSSPAQSKPSKILAIYRDKKTVEILRTGETGSIILDRTPFYAESGGQIGDQGSLHHNGNFFRVVDTQKQGGAYLHMGAIEKGELKLNDEVIAEINAERRAATVLNHTATHLLHKVLHQTFGDHVLQKGSLVGPDRLRFDFAYPSPLKAEEIKLIEQRVNQEIRANHKANVRTTSLEEAVQNGAVALFEEKYGKEVRVVRFGGSIELCGGTHAHHTGDIGLFKIISESGIAAGIRRIEAVTGRGALDWIDQQEKQHIEELSQAEDRLRTLEKQLEQLKNKFAYTLSQDLLHHYLTNINGLNLLVAKLKDIDIKTLRATVDLLKNKLGSAVIVLGVINNNKVGIVVGVTQDHTAKVKAGELVSQLAEQVGGKGGGRPDLAEAGGSQPEHLEKALDSVTAWIKTKV